MESGAKRWCCQRCVVLAAPLRRQVPTGAPAELQQQGRGIGSGGGRCSTAGGMHGRVAALAPSLLPLRRRQGGGCQQHKAPGAPLHPTMPQGQLQCWGCVTGVRGALLSEPASRPLRTLLAAAVLALCAGVPTRRQRRQEGERGGRWEVGRWAGGRVGKAWRAGPVGGRGPAGSLQWWRGRGGGASVAAAAEARRRAWGPVGRWCAGPEGGWALLEGGGGGGLGRHPCAWVQRGARCSGRDGCWGRPECRSSVGSGAACAFRTAGAGAGAGAG